MAVRTVREMLGDNPLLQGVGKRDIGRIHDAGTEMTFAPGEEITQKGMIGSDVYLMLRGKAEVRRGGERIAELTPGTFFGELSVLTGSPRSADVVATERLIALRLDAEGFRETLERHGPVAYRVLETAARRLHETGTVLS